MQYAVCCRAKQAFCAGIAHCKILAKLAAGLHKPSQQTLVPAASVPGLLHDLPIPKLRQLGGKFGEELQQQLGIKTVGEATFTAQKLLLCLSRSNRDSELGSDAWTWSIDR